MVTDEFVRGWVDRLRHEIPDAVAIFLGGSRLLAADQKPQRWAFFIPCADPLQLCGYPTLLTYDMVPTGYRA